MNPGRLAEKSTDIVVPGDVFPLARRVFLLRKLLWTSLMDFKEK